MTRQQAEQRAIKLNRALAEGADHRWIAHHAQDCEWAVARVSASGMRLPAPDGLQHGGRGPERGAPVDPRPTITRLIPPVGPPGL